VVPAVHSLKVRVKDPASLVAKVIRKRLADADRVITPDNYATEITDLIGIRAMHLFKDDWRAIHDFINVTWTLHETPIAYYRAGDHQDVLAGFSESGCDLREHVAGYRSVHYIVESTPTKERTLAELQVRTVFEEAWSEIDHLVRYPNLTDDPVLNHFLGLFNRTAGMADEMGTFLQRLRNELQRRQAQADDAIAAHQNRIAALEEQVAALNIEKGQKEALERQLSEIRKGPAWSVGGLSGFTFDSPQPEIRFTYTPGIGSIGLNFGSDRPIADSWGGIVGLSRKCTSCGQTFASAPTFGDYDTRCPSCRAAR
jgi:ppGpp synthetase/RelA/SpoT-type nucleotidyltranferase